MKLIHLTDTHFVPQHQTLYGRDPSVALKRCLADINSNHADADLCVITGDLTHWGEPEAFDHLTDCLSTLSIPLRLLIGNHDSHAEFIRRLPDQELDENGFVQSCKDYAVVLFESDRLIIHTHDSLDESPEEEKRCGLRSIGLKKFLLSYVRFGC